MRHSFSFYKRIWIILLVCFISLFVIKAVYIASNNSNLYEITVHTYSGDIVYYTSSFKVDTTNNCISFKDEFGIYNTICGQYSIQQW